VKLHHQVLRCSPPGAASSPEELESFPAPETRPLAVENFTTVAAALIRGGRFDPLKESLHPDGFDIDAYDWWLTGELSQSDDRRWLMCNGLSVGSKVFVDGVLLHRSDSAWLPVELAMPPGALRVAICFPSISAMCESLKSVDRAHRARWKTRLVTEQRLRLLRTPLLGRMPGWNLRLPIVGVHGTIGIVAQRAPKVVSRSATQQPDGRWRVLLSVSHDRAPDGLPVLLILGDNSYPMNVADDHRHLTADVVVTNPPLWWPATHGSPTTVPMSVRVGGIQHRLAPVAFRTVVVDHGDSSHGGATQGAGISVNGVRIFARGVNWVPVDAADPFSAGVDPSDMRTDDALAALAAAGMNMVRVAGTTLYESEKFYETCTELGIMVWQDYMFANLDVPVDAPGMKEAIAAEVEMVASQIAIHGSVIVLCGGSEVEQQAAMAGASRDVVASTLGRTVLRELSAVHAPHTAYVTSSPTAAPGNHGAPHHHTSGFSHYFGVGAYRRGMLDARVSQVSFATECLAYAHVPSSASVDRVMGDEGPAVHHPLWKRGVPRDRGTGWDFDDVRDHAIREVFDVDPTEIRWTDPLRYLDLSRAAMTEVFDATFSEWRRGGSRCSGALVWTGRDVFPGAGWGITEHDGTPKSAWFGMARRCAATMLSLVDEGLNGIVCNLVNDLPNSVTGQLSLGVFDGANLVKSAEHSVVLGARSMMHCSLSELLCTYADYSNAYGFGLPSCDLIRARFSWVDERCIQQQSESHVWPTGRPSGTNRADVVSASIVSDDVASGIAVVKIESKTGAFGIHLDADGWDRSDDWFHLAPGDARLVTVRRRNTSASSRVVVRAITAPSSVSVSFGGNP
jgi:beta-mannosidase